jgi:hypothetical protein
VYCMCSLQPNLLTAPADERWKAIRKAVAVSFSAQVCSHGMCNQGVQRGSAASSGSWGRGRVCGVGRGVGGSGKQPARSVGGGGGRGTACVA